MSTEEFSRKSLRLSRSGIEIWKFLTSYIRALVGRSFSSLVVSTPSGATALIGLPLAFPYPRARTPSRSPHVCTHTFAHSSYPYHIFLHIIPLFSGPHLLVKREHQKDENRWCARTRVSPGANATTRRFDMLPSGEETDANVLSFPCTIKRVQLISFIMIIRIK